MKISILGSGAYGIALSFMFHENKHDITLWTKFEEEKEMLEKERKNEKILPNIILPQEYHISTDLKECVENADLIVLAIPAEFIESTCNEMKNYIQKPKILIASKGIDNKTGAFLYEIVQKYFKEATLAVISGPTFAIDLARLHPSALTLASKDSVLRKNIKKALQNQYLMIEELDDIPGVSVCGAYKNIVAIASGILEGLSCSITTKAMFLTAAFNEMKTLILALGGNEKTMLSFSGYGDFLLTCTSEKSRNFTLGTMLGSKKDKEDINHYIQNTTIEGLYTLNSILKIMEQKNIELLLVPTLSEIIKGNMEPEKLQYIFHQNLEK